MIVTPLDKDSQIGSSILLRGAADQVSPVQEDIHPALHKPEIKNNFRKEFLGKYSHWMYVISSIFHLGVAGISSLSGFDKETKNRIAKGATFFTKLVNSIFYGDLAIDAWQNKNTFDFISKILEPILNCFSQLSNYHLLRSLGSAMTQLHLVNLPHIAQKDNLWANFIENLQLAKKFFVEAWTSSLFGSESKLFRAKDDKGHRLALLSHIQGVAGIIGLLNGARRNFIDKIVGTVRNFIGVLVDLDLLFKKDIDEKLTGASFFIHAIFDTAKRFLSKEKADIVDHLIMPIYNKAMYHFGKLTRKQSEGTYQTSVA